MSSYTITSPTGESYTISPPEETKYDKTTGDAAGWNPPGFQPEPSLQEPVNTAIVAASSVPMAAVNAAKNIGELESGKGDSDAVDREITSLNQSRANMMQGNTTAQTANSIGATIPTMNAVGFISKASTLGKLGEGAGFLRQAGTDIAKTAGEGALYGAGGELSNPGSQDPNQERQDAISSAETGAIANMTLGATKYAGDKFGEVVNWFKRNGSQAGNNMKAAEIVATQLKPDAEQRLNEFVNTPKDQRPSNLTTAEAADSGELAALQRRTEQQKPLPIGPNGEKVEPGQVFLQQNQANKDKLAGEVQALGNPAVDRTALGKVAQSEVNTAQEGIAAPVKQAETNLNSAEQAHTTNTSTVAQELDNLKANTAKVTSEAGQQVEQAKSDLNEAANTTKSAVASDLTTKERTTGRMANENTKQQYLDELDKQRQVENAAYSNIDKTGSKFIPLTDATVAANKLVDEGKINPSDTSMDALLTDKNGKRIMDKYRPKVEEPSLGFKSSDLGSKQMGIPVVDSTSTHVSAQQIVQDITDLNQVKRNAIYEKTNGSGANKGHLEAVINAADEAKQVLERTLHESGIASDIPNKTVGDAYKEASSLVAQNNEALTRSSNVSRTGKSGTEVTNETPLDSVKDKYLSGGNVGNVGKTILDNPETTFSNMKNVENGPEYVKQQVLAHVADKLGETPSVSAFDKVFDGSTRRAMLENGMKQQHDEIMALRQQMQDAEDKVSSAQDNFSKVNEDAQATLAEKKAAQDSITKASKDSLQQQKDLLVQAREEAQAKQKELAKTTEYKLLDKDTGLPKPPEVQARLLMDNPQYQQRALELANKEPSGMALQGLGESIHDTILHDSIPPTEGFTPKYDADGNRLYYHEIDPMAYDAALDKNADILKATKGEGWFNDAKEKAQLARVLDSVAKVAPSKLETDEMVRGLQTASAKGIAQKLTGMSYTALNMLTSALGQSADVKFETALAKMLQDPDYGSSLLKALKQMNEDKASQKATKDLINQAWEAAKSFGSIQAGKNINPKKVSPDKVNQNLDNELHKVYNKSDNSGSIFDAINPVGTAKADGISDLIDKFNNERKPGGIGPVGGEIHLTGTKNDVAQVVPTDNLPDIIQKTADKWNIPVAYLKGLQQSESGGEVNPLTAKPKDGSTSAVGPFQFTTGTWEQVRKAYPFLHLPAIGQGKDPRTDPQLSATAAAALTTYDVHELSKVLDRPVTMADARLAHVGGLGGAKKILAAKPSEIAADILPKAAKTNPGLFYKNGKALSIRAFYSNLEKPYKDNTTDITEL